MVRGSGMAVTAVALPYQCADTATMASGLLRASSRPSSAQARECRLSSMAFIGDPWPRNRAG